MSRRSAPSSHDYGTRQPHSTDARAEAIPTDHETWIGQRIIPQANGCWTFDGHVTPTGQVHSGGYRVHLARFVYETLHRTKLSTWVTLDTTCTTEHCCNPEHQVERDRRR